MAHASYVLVFDVDDEAARGLERLPEGFVEGHEPRGEIIWMN
jgi:hypothetical protein